MHRVNAQKGDAPWTVTLQAHWISFTSYQNDMLTYTLWAPLKAARFNPHPSETFTVMVFYASLPSSCSVRKMWPGKVINNILCFNQSHMRIGKKILWWLLSVLLFDRMSVRVHKVTNHKMLFLQSSTAFIFSWDLFLYSHLYDSAWAWAFGTVVGQVLEADSEE